MTNIKNFFKGIVVGIGGIAPGLSGSVLMVILGLYAKVISTIATLFKNFKKNILFLMPIGIGMILGIVLFSRVIDYSMGHYEIQTRLLFLGLLLGTIPIFYKEVKRKKDIKKQHYIIICVSLILGLLLLTFTKPLINSSDLNIFQAFILGFIGISAMVLPGVDGAAVLSTLGLYDNWLDLTSLNNIRLSLYVPAFIGIIAGGFLLSMFINAMLKKNYTMTFSILFGLFLSIIPNILKNSEGSFISLSNNSGTYIGIVLLIIGVVISYFFGKINKEE